MKDILQALLHSFCFPGISEDDNNDCDAFRVEEILSIYWLLKKTDLQPQLFCPKENRPELPFVGVNVDGTFVYTNSRSVFTSLPAGYEPVLTLKPYLSKNAIHLMGK